MAGGIGSRFWPHSRKKKPKQVLKIFGDKTLLQETVTRIEPLIAPSEILIVTTEELIGHIQKQLPDFGEDNFLVEPIGRNTAPCIGLAAQKLIKSDPDGIMVVLPADHLISDAGRFITCLEQAIETAKMDDSLVTIGITPTQKPTLDTAQRFLASGDFLWNSGIFIWSIRRILSEIERSLPELYAGLMQIEALEGEGAETQFQHIYSSCQGRFQLV